MQSGLFRIKPYYSFDVSQTGLVCYWKGAEETIEDEANRVMLLSPGETVFSSKKLELTLKPTQSKMMFTINESNVEPGVPFTLCSFAINFPQSEEPIETKINLSIEVDSNRMLKNVSANLAGEKE
jgi:hypothetical protein